LFITLSKLIHHCQIIALILSKYTPLHEETSSGSGKQETATMLHDLLESVSDVNYNLTGEICPFRPNNYNTIARMI